MDQANKITGVWVNMMYDVTIIGAGVVGAFIARELSRYQIKVCLVEKEADVANGSTKANSAIIHAGYDAQNGSLKGILAPTAGIICPYELTIGAVENAVLNGVELKLETRVDDIKQGKESFTVITEGGFCTPKIVFILSKELQIPVDEITKKGRNSRLLLGIAN